MGLELEPNSEFMVSNVCARDWGYVSNCLTLNKSPTVNNPIWRQNGNIWRFLSFGGHFSCLSLSFLIYKICKK